MNRELRQSYMILSEAKLEIVQATEKSSPRLGGRLYKNGDIISASPLGYNRTSPAPYDGRLSTHLDIDQAREIVRYNHPPIGQDIRLQGRSIYGDPPGQVPLESKWFFAEATYEGVGVTSVTRPDNQVESDPDDPAFCAYPTWVNLGRLVSPVLITTRNPGTIPPFVFDPNPPDSFESYTWAFNHWRWGVALQGSVPSSCPPPDPEPPGWEPPDRIVQSPKSVTIHSIVGSVYLSSSGEWLTSSSLVYDEGVAWSPPSFRVNYGFTPYLEFSLGPEGWG